MSRAWTSEQGQGPHYQTELDQGNFRLVIASSGSDLQWRSSAPALCQVTQANVNRLQVGALECAADADCVITTAVTVVQAAVI